MNDSYDETIGVLCATLGTLCALTLLAVLVAQIYKAGQRNPDPAKYCTYAQAVELATERQQMGFDKGFQDCKEPPNAH